MFSGPRNWASDIKALSVRNAAPERGVRTANSLLLVEYRARGIHERSDPVCFVLCPCYPLPESAVGSNTAVLVHCLCFHSGNTGLNLFRSLTIMRLLFESPYSFDFFSLSLFTFALPTFLFLPKPLLPFEMFFPPFSVNRFRLKA